MIEYITRTLLKSLRILGNSQDYEKLGKIRDVLVIINKLSVFLNLII